MKQKLAIFLITIILYWVLKNYVPFGGYILYPITLLVTFFHETGHAFFAVITGGSVKGIQINNDGSGYAMLAGGLSLLVIPGGYIGSALWGNLILNIAFFKERYSNIFLYFIIAVLIFSAIIWFNSIGSSALLLAFAAITFWVSRRTKQTQNILLIIIGTGSLVYILMDFNGGPSSDLSKFTALIPILPQFAWAIVWLSIVVYLTYLNLRGTWEKS
jgi:hypothetical protein